MRTMKRAKLAALAGSIVFATTISACASDEASRPHSAQQSVEQFAGIVFDYDPLASPAALAEQSRLVVTGTIDRVQEGRVEIVPKNENIPGISTIVLVLRDPKAVVGSVDERTDGLVYVELPNPGGHDPDAYQDGLREGSSVVAYLVPASDGVPVEGVDTAIADPKAGRPAGQALYLPAGPQALILQYENEAVVWPLIGEARDGRLEDTLPGGKLIAP
ncbi:hypothetical protein RCH16_002632 [Cryobacterium sp. MP_M5]|uniref:hypothetical protein n=1 Tax=unclassified Cryobacterium TaxID=2649013 RepID=UPI0018C8EBEA|nr:MULTISPECIES: hypothetical protein [unclassified Cryobacterium]MBG6059409.1 hypothetical protein [Cryobacterium sp. MP_M3]MEC5177612.1 hypothetical protein [Cryobacterium sp. MP_M5]